MATARKRAVKKTSRKTATKTTRKPTPKQAHILETVGDHPDLTTREVARICDTDHTHVVRTLQRYGIDKREADDYRKNRADILAGVQHRLLASITESDIQQATLLQRTTAVSQLFDKERLERGKSTSNASVLFALVEQACADRAQGQSSDPDNDTANRPTSASGDND